MTDVIRTFPGVEGPPIWFDIISVKPGQYDVQLAHSGQIVASGFTMPTHAEEWVVSLQDMQREHERLIAEAAALRC